MDNILPHINEKSTMLDFTELIIKNIKFYLKHKEELNDIGYSEEFLIQCIDKLEIIKIMYKENTIPTWFKEYRACLFLSGSFPYVNALLDFTFSFFDMVDMVLSKGKNVEYVNGITYEIKEVKPKDSTHVNLTYTNERNYIYSKYEWNQILKEII